MEIIVFLSIVIAVVAVLTSIVLVRRVKKQAEKVWNLIQASFILSDVEEIEPDPEELEALRDRKSVV